MRHSALTPVFTALRWALHVLLIVLIVFAMVHAVVIASPHAIAVHVLGTAMLVVYLGGAAVTHVRGFTGRRVNIVSFAWVGVLTALWIAMMMVTVDAAYIVFPLFFLFLHLLPATMGVVAIVVSTTLTIAMLGFHSGQSVGGVVGPVIGAAVALAISAGYGALHREATEREKLIAELQATRGELAVAEREAGVLAERDRLAREIHDTVAQGLSSIQLLLHAAERVDAARPGLEQIQLARQTAADALVDTRRIIRELTPPALDEQTLHGALRRLAASAEHTMRAGGRATEVRFHPVGDVRQLPMAVETTLLRVAQSALANVQQHADAAVVDLTLTIDDDAVTLDVVDDGTGFDPAGAFARRGPSFGLTAIRRRVTELGGSLIVESAPGEGTALAATIPAPEEDDA
ncbi:Signal transduction histidine kinase [Paramicrobacterium humi]|uniref:Oxygen sensor histidine kinase NreB n=1 Tax=Paramicrobacterium humi TaxID=640635 RepID=A0A1H4MDX7_9MICO|nr:sensor histidine kinase [Microbacterium humi]SEB81057.1 Signal transduction histidine kinase [Microbacterium humi]